MNVGMPTFIYQATSVTLTRSFLDRPSNIPYIAVSQEGRVK